MNIISAQQACQELEKNKQLIQDKKEIEIRNACKTFMEKSEKIIEIINRNILDATMSGKTQVSLIVLPTCFTIEKFEKTLKYIFVQCGYDVETEIIRPQTQQIISDSNTCCVAMNLSWDKQKLEETKLAEIQNKISKLFSAGKVSDGYHTFDELYHHRAVLFAMICNQNKEKAWKSKLHNTGDMYDGMFIVGVETPYGQATYHYDIDPYWDMFQIKELNRAPKWDGHNPQEAIDRIEKWSMFL